MSKLNMIEGIGPSYEMKLKEAGIRSVEKLLEFCADKKHREELAKKTGISEKLILTWANHADLFRVKGIGGQYAELLEAAGVDSVLELAQRKPHNLYEKMMETNEKKHLVHRIPTETMIKHWVDASAKLPKVIHH